MEVCPYCKKPFKRLKSHLLHCKMTGSSIPADQKVSQSKTATLTKQEKRPARDSARAKGKELETEDSKRTVKVETSQAEWTTTASPLPERVLESTRTTKAGETKDQKLLSFRVLRVLSHIKPEVTLQRVTAPQSPASDATSPKTEFTRDVSESKGSPHCPSETEASSLVGSMEPFSTKQEREHASTPPHAKPATSARLRLDTVDPQRQKGDLVKLDVPTGDCHSPKNGSHEVQRVAPSVSSREKSSQDGSHLSGVSPYSGNPETQRSESLLLGLHTGLLGKEQVREHQELGLGTGLSHSKGNTENRMSVTDGQEATGLGHSGKDPITATKAKPQATLEFRNVFMPPQGALSQLLPVPGSENQSLPSLAVTSTPEEKDQFYGQSQVPAITLRHHLVSDSAQCHIPENFLSRHAAATSEAPLRSVGLEWFPELYPGYVGLGVLARRPQPWNSAAQVPAFATSQGKSVSKVPWWGRSSADSRSLEPLALTTSSLPLMRLLGAVHKGWVRCNTTIKKSGVGRLTMLFAGYFVLCCSWSFKHLKLQRWRK